MSGAPALRALDWTINHHAVSILPDPSYLILARATVQRPGKRLYDLLGFGAPSIVVAAPGATGAAGATAAPPWLAADASWLADLPPIPEAAKELGSLAALFAPTRSKLLLGAAATKPAVLRELAEGAQVIAFATHGFASGDIDRVVDPALLLSLAPGNNDPTQALLTSSDLAGVRIDADLAILSACNTASPDSRPFGEAFSGLATSLLYAGVKTLIVSHWQVASGAAETLSSQTVARARHGGSSLARSLQATSRALRDDPAPACQDVRAHPFYWAPFVLVATARVI